MTAHVRPQQQFIRSEKRKKQNGKRRWQQNGQDLNGDYNHGQFVKSFERRRFPPNGQDPPGDVPDPDFHRDNIDLDQSLAPASLTTESDLNGIHPSRLGLFNLEQGAGDLGMATAAVMAPPGNNGRHPHQYVNSHTQQKSNSGNTNSDGNNQSNQQQKHRSSEKDQRPPPRDVSPPTPIGRGPMPNHIQVAKPYVFQQAIEGCLKDIGVPQAREDNIRLAGVQWIDNVRRALKLPVRTFDTAVIYYHKFRLVHSDGEYSFVDAAAAALFAACKIEDTLKKSRDILCAAHNLKISNRAEHLAPDDSTFEHHSRAIIGLERLMLESSSFDFRNRHPQHLLMKIAKNYSIPKSATIMKTAYKISLDLYRTFAPLKHSTATLAFSCLELSARLLKETTTYPGLQDIINGTHYHQWKITRAEVMETLLDLLELYTIYRNNTLLGTEFPLDTFLEVRIPLNEELNENHLPRFTEYIDPSRISGRADPGSYAATVNGISVGTPATTSTATAANGLGITKNNSPSTNAKPGQNGIRQKAGERGKEGTVRFMLNPDREREERAIVAEYGPHPGIASASAPGGGGGVPIGAGRGMNPNQQ